MSTDTFPVHPAASIPPKIEAAWTHRAATLGLKPKSAKYLREQAAFFAGAITALDAADATPRGEDNLSRVAPARWVIQIIRGEVIA